MDIIKRSKKLLSEKQYEEAIDLLESSPSEKTAFEIGLIYGNKDFKEIYSPEKTLNIMRSLIKKNYIPAKYKMGNIYINGDCNEGFNPVKADELFRGVANEKNKDLRVEFFEEITLSCLEIAKIYDKGYAGEVDKREALRYYKKAAENKSLTYAFFKVGEIILEIEPQNYSEALYYLNKSNDDKYQDSIRLSTKIYLKLVKTNLKRLNQMDKNSVDYQIILNKLKNIDEDLL